MMLIYIFNGKYNIEIAIVKERKSTGTIVIDQVEFKSLDTQKISKNLW